MIKLRLACIGLFVLLLTAPTTLADGGMIVPHGASVYEPGQKAIIAWNDGREVLILSVDVYGSENTWALEILPLPSEPTVEAGSFDSFEAIEVLLWGYARGMYFNEGYGALKAGVSESLEVIFHEQIGAHDITVVAAGNAQELISWAEDLLGARAQEISWGRLESVAVGYIQREIKYWVFDLVDLSDRLKSREPIVYTFESDKLYFPLEMSSLMSGSTEITLYALTEDRLDPQSVQKSDFSIQSFEAGEENVPVEFEVNNNDLQRISSEVAELFEDNAWLTVLKYSGNLDDLRGDLMLEAVAGPPPPSPPIPIETWILGIGITIIAAIVVLGLLGVRFP